MFNFLKFQPPFNCHEFCPRCGRRLYPANVTCSYFFVTDLIKLGNYVSEKPWNEYLAFSWKNCTLLKPSFCRYITLVTIVKVSWLSAKNWVSLYIYKMSSWFWPSDQIRWHWIHMSFFVLLFFSATVMEITSGSPLCPLQITCHPQLAFASLLPCLHYSCYSGN